MNIYYILINSRKTHYLLYISIIIICYAYAGTDYGYAIMDYVNGNSSTIVENQIGFIKFKDNLSGIEISHPPNWEVENGKLINLKNISLTNPIKGNIIKNNHTNIVYTTSVTNIFDTFPAFIKYNENNSKPIAFPSISFFSPLENPTDNFLENIKIIPKLISSNTSLNHLIEYISVYSERQLPKVISSNMSYDEFITYLYYSPKVYDLLYYTYITSPEYQLSNIPFGQYLFSIYTKPEIWDSILYSISRNPQDWNSLFYPSFDLFKLMGLQNILLNNNSLQYYVNAFIDFYKSGILSFELLENHPIEIAELPAHLVSFTFNLDTKLHNTGYKITQIYVLKEDEISLIIYTALNTSYSQFLPTVNSMINSLIIN